MELDDEAVESLLDQLDAHHVVEKYVARAIQWMAATQPSKLIANIETGLKSDDADEAPLEFEHGRDENNGKLVSDWADRMSAAGARMLALWTVTYEHEHE